MRLLLPVSLILFAGCVSTPRPTSPAVVPAAAVAAKERYRALQEAHRPKPAPSEFELIPLVQPEREEGGVLRTATIEYLRVPRSP